MSNETGEALARRLEEATAAVIAVAEACTDEQWQTVVPEEGRTVGVLFHHIAYPTPLTAGWAMNVAAGNHLLRISRDAADSFNHDHADEYADVGKAETIALLKQVSADAAERLRTLSDEQLARTSPLRLPFLSIHAVDEHNAEELLGSEEISAAQIVEWNLIRHRYDHLRQIEAVLGV